MGKRKESGFDVLASMPWPACLVLGLIGFIGIEYGIGWLWGSSSNPFLSAFARVSSTGIYAPLAWLALVGCCIAALASFLGRRKRRHLLESQTRMDSLRSMDWRSFERLVGEAFRRQGYVVKETGQGGADGGVDLELHKEGQITLVQCKQWRSQSVGVQTVREMFGILVDRGAIAVKIVALGGYTLDAAAFARGKRIELVDGSALLATVRSIQARKEPELALDNPLFFASGVLACLLVAAALPKQYPGHPANVPGASLAPSPAPIQSGAATQDAPVIRIPPTPLQATASPNQKTYQADPPMSNEEQREWEKRNREAMKILEKTTPELETAPTH
ncbi:restriction endonuclease [Dyella amyloliquefaciens]|uniref:restriction endonuclease n=1 Tax=Dyella amyloliquefaciens TaxID=1770545 RepID=UPI00102E8713|nr:restriction endonuclease [Dyella amyloliquefaciens]